MQESETIENIPRRRNIEKLYIKTKNTIILPFLEKIEDPILKQKLEKQFHKKLQLLNSTYEKVKDQFKHTLRKGWQRYFNHVTQVARIYLESMSKIEQKLSKIDCSNQIWRIQAIELINNEFERIIIALEHDTLEDTDISFEAMAQGVWARITLWVQLVTKPAFWDFITDQDDLILLDKIKQSWVLNSKWLLNHRFKLKQFLMSNGHNHEEKTILFWNQSYNISPEEKHALKIYNTLKNKYKEIRDDAYYIRFASLESMIELAQEINKKYTLRLSEIDIYEVAQNAIEIKIADRSHNLNDMWPLQNTPEKIQKKIDETNNKLLHLAYQIDMQWYKLLEEAIQEAQSVIFQAVCKTTQQWVDQIIHKN